MTGEVRAFLEAGRKFRSEVRQGSVMVVERSSDLRGYLQGWLQTASHQPVLACSTPTEALQRLAQDPSSVRCVLLGLSPQDAPDLVDRVEYGFPGLVVVVYTSDTELASVLLLKHPRVTTICIREGLVALLQNLQAEIVPALTRGVA